MGDLKSLLESISEQDEAANYEKHKELPDEFVRHIMIYILHGKLPPIPVQTSVSNPPFEANWSTFSLRFNEYFLNRNSIFKRFTHTAQPADFAVPLEANILLDRLAESETQRLAQSKELASLRTLCDTKDAALAQAWKDLDILRSQLKRSDALVRGSVTAEFQASKALEAKIADLERKLLLLQAQNDESENSIITMKKQNAALRVVVEAHLRPRMTLISLVF